MRDCLRYLALNAPATLTIVAGSQVALTETAEAGVVDGRVRVLGAGELLFDRAEASQMLHAQLGARAEALPWQRAHDLMGGWPLGLQILATAAQAGASGSHDILQEPSLRQGFDAYVQRFVLDDLPAGDVDFLVRVSHASRLSPGLCSAMTGRADSAEILERLVSSTPLFDQALAGPWVRMHGLVRECLRRVGAATLGEEERARLHARAAEWLAAQDMPEHAAWHALCAHRQDWAYDLVAQSLSAIWGRGDLDRALDWVDRIPEEELARRPLLAIVAASALSHVPRRSEQRERLMAAAVQQATPELPLRREAAAVALQVAISHDDGALAGELLAQWGSELGKGCAALDVVLSAAASMAATYRGETEKARHLWTHVEVSRDAPGARLAWYFREASIADTYLWEGKPDAAEQVLRPLLAELEAAQGRRGLLATAAAALLAAAQWDLGRVAEAAELLEDRLDVLERVQLFRPVYMGLCTAARLAAMQGDAARAFSLLEHLFFLGELTNTPRYAVESLGEQIRLHAHARRPAICGALLERMEQQCAAPAVLLNPGSADYCHVLLCLARVQVCAASGDYAQALPHVRDGLAVATRLALGRQRLMLLLLEALANRRSGEPGNPLALHEVVGLARTYGLRSIVADTHPDLKDLLGSEEQAFFAASAPEDRAPSVLPGDGATAKVIETQLLTPRERDVLQGLANGLRNKQIAGTLGLSEETVKWHVKNLLDKLGGANRKHVVDRARQLGVVVRS